MDYPGIDGFLGTRASLMLDLVALAMLAVLPVLAWSIWLVRYRRNYLWHKRVQLVLGGVLAIAVTAFEIDIRLHGWEERAVSPDIIDFFPPATGVAQLVYTALWVHLFFAVTTVGMWLFVIVQALRKIPDPPGPCDYSPRHIFWAWLAAIDMACTAVTGWVFYWLAFVD
jgi:uncharacterized membrane protein YozB (DUF420 family)